MGLEEQEVQTSQLTLGMYVCRLDRPWEESPFLMQGFELTTADDIAQLQSLCRSVWIDVQRGPGPRDAPLAVLQRSKAAPRALPDPEAALGSQQHVDSVRFDQELAHARAAQDNAVSLAGKILDDVRAGRKLSPEDVSHAVEPVVRSVLRSADAMFWVNALRKHNAYAYSHAINCSALAAAFGRQLGLPAELLVEAASGALLLDIGKAMLPVELLSHPGTLDAQGMAQARGHVELSLHLLDQGGVRSPLVRDMIRTHHERFDGSGYPDRISGTAIPLFGRMGAIIDSFDAMTSERPHAPAMARHEALQEIYRHRNTLYQGEMVEQFIGCLGVYPTGSLVELSSGEVAVVMAQNPTRRLRPRVMLLTDPDKQLRASFMSLDLMAQAKDAAGESQIDITTPLPVGAYGLDPAELYL
ncbi:MAG: HD-GYP domain-containing protein [Pseudomonadota bacterium]|nr:HD-GYP domain-containing protein [Pseudomonadota bacterium]